MILAIHTAAGIVALLFGAWNLAARKGTRRHRAVGWTYAGSMTIMVVTSFGIFDIFGAFGPYHAMSVVSGVTLGLALYFPVFRRNHARWLEHHYMWISFSYVGLLMATGSHFFEAGPPGWSMWARAALYWGFPLVVGYALILGRRRATLGRVRSRESAA